MVGNWTDFEKTVAAMEELRRRMEEANLAQLFGREPSVAHGARWPRVSLRDHGSKLVLEADLPGVKEADVQVTLTSDVLTVAGSRGIDSPEGYSVHRQERRPLQFSRSFTLPCKVSADAIEARLEHGVLTVTMPKAPESRPRQITVKTA